MDLKKEKSKLIIVCGLSGSGKSTLAEQLSIETGIVCLHKDSLKEKLYDILELQTLEDSKDVGAKAIKLFFKLIEEQLMRNVDLIIEAPFNFTEDYQIFEKWKDKLDLEVYSIICSIDDKTRKKRIEERPRHKSHHDAERIIQWSVIDEDNYDQIPAKQIRITTDISIQQNIDYIVSKLGI